MIKVGPTFLAEQNTSVTSQVSLCCARDTFKCQFVSQFQPAFMSTRTLTHPLISCQVQKSFFDFQPLHWPYVQRGQTIWTVIQTLKFESWTESVRVTAQREINAKLKELNLLWARKTCSRLVTLRFCWYFVIKVEENNNVFRSSVFLFQRPRCSSCSALRREMSTQQVCRKVSI